jgi:hypothetical protein
MFLPFSLRFISSQEGWADVTHCLQKAILQFSVSRQIRDSLRHGGRDLGHLRDAVDGHLAHSRDARTLTDPRCGPSCGRSESWNSSHVSFGDIRESATCGGPDTHDAETCSRQASSIGLRHSRNTASRCSPDRFFGIRWSWLGQRISFLDPRSLRFRMLRFERRRNCDLQYLSDHSSNT